MVNQYLFVEEGSLAPNDIAKIVENIKNTGASLIMYNKGAAKPELVSLNISEVDIDKIRQEAIENHTNYILENLLKYMTLRSTIYHIRDEMTCIIESSMRIEGIPEEFVDRFKNFLNEIKG